MFYNYFNKFITGLGLNRASFEQDVPKRAPEGVVSKKVLDQSLKDYSEGKVIMAAGETTDEYLARMEKMKQDDKKKLAELEAKNKRTPVYAETTETPFGDISVAKKGKPRLRDRQRTVVGTRAEEGATAKPKPTDAEQAIAEADRLMAKEKADREIATLLGEEYKEATPMTDQELIAYITGEGATEEVKEAEMAALGKSREVPGSEFAYVEQDMNEANINKLAHWMQNLRFVAEAISKGKDLKESVYNLQAKLNEDQSVNVGYLGQMAEKAGAKAGMSEKQIASLIFDKIKNYPADRNKRIFLESQFKTTYGN